MYTKLNTSRDEIRLLRIFPRSTYSDQPDISSPDIHLEIFNASLNEDPKFNTLSYTWGSPDSLKHDVFLNGCRFPVGNNLFSALKEFSSWAAPPVIWIDAICIDQCNKSERSQQVRRMKRIYEQAEEVSVWLGPHENGSHQAFHVLKDLTMLLGYQEAQFLMGMYLEDNEPLEDPEVPKGLRALASIFLRDYWHRMWVVQELTVAKRIMIHVGDCSADAAVFNRVQGLLRGLDAKLTACLHHDEYTRNALVLQGMLEITEWKQALESGELTFHDCLRHHQLRRSTDPRDKLYALAAIANGKSKLHIEIDYSAPVTKVYTDFARAEIQTSAKLDILTSVLRGDGTNPHRLPSWVPDWSDPFLREHLFLGDKKYAFAAAAKTEPSFSLANDGDVLRVKAFQIGHVAQLGQATEMEDAERQVKGVVAIYAWWKLHQNLCAAEDHMPCVEKFIRTIRCAHEERHTREGSETIFADLFTLLTIYRAKAHLPEIAPPLDPIVLELQKRIYETRAQAAKGESNWESNEGLQSQALARVLLPNFVFMCDRRFFMLADGTFGLAPDLTMEGDLVCVPLGCPHPMILRRDGDHFVLIGEAYVDGYMYGKTVDMFEVGNLECVEFELH